LTNESLVIYKVTAKKEEMGGGDGGGRGEFGGSLGGVTGGLVEIKNQRTVHKYLARLLGTLREVTLA
jgi:hypothetical protein